jgi:hypothetical protein
VRGSVTPGTGPARDKVDLVAKSFPADFYITCATVIPILYLALAVQGTYYGSGYEAALVTALRRARKQTGQRWADAARKLWPLAAFLPLMGGLIGETLAFLVLFGGLETVELGIRVIVLVTILPLVAIVGVGPARRWWQVQTEVNKQEKDSISQPEFGQDDRQVLGDQPD